MAMGEALDRMKIIVWKAAATEEREREYREAFGERSCFYMENHHLG
jgi:hypothetical protein